jgi:hypothetical protein
MLRRIPNRAFRTCADALLAEEATAQIQRKALVVDANRVGWASFDAVTATARTAGRIDDRKPSEAIRERRRLARICHRSMTLFHSTKKDSPHVLP